MSDVAVRPQIGELLREWRGRRRLTQMDLALEAGFGLSMDSIEIDLGADVDDVGQADDTVVGGRNLSGVELTPDPVAVAMAQPNASWRVGLRASTRARRGGVAVGLAFGDHEVLEAPTDQVGRSSREQARERRIGRPYALVPLRVRGPPAPSAPG